MKLNEQVWLLLAQEAIEHQRYEWAGLEELAHALDAPVSSTHLALEHPRRIGAIAVRPRQGIVVVDPAKLLVLLKAARNLTRDRLARVHVDSVSILDPRSFIIGGTHAASALLKEKIPTAEHGIGLLYVQPDEFAKVHPAELSIKKHLDDEVWVLAAPKKLELEYESHTGVVQTLVDLFAMPGWRAVEFENALSKRFLSPQPGVEVFSR